MTTATNGHLPECISCETWNDNLGDTIEFKSLGGGIPSCDVVPIPGDLYRTQCERVVLGTAMVLGTAFKTLCGRSCSPRAQG